MFRIAFPRSKESNPYYFSAQRLKAALELADRIVDYASENGACASFGAAGGHRNKTGYDTVLEIKTDKDAAFFKSVIETYGKGLDIVIISGDSL
ncbi:MAG: hypothetical protein ACTTJZ_06565 [Sphaerochaetaceae bacterium]